LCRYAEDESRTMAAAMFPEVVAEGLLKRKKDHGRAEALLIAAYGHMAAEARRGYDDGADAGDGDGDAGDEAAGDGDGDGDGDGNTAATADPLCTRIRDMVTESAAAAAASGDGDGEEDSSGLRRRVGPDDPLPYFGPYFGMTGKALSNEARARGLKVSGKKMELVGRLEEDDVLQRRRRREAKEQRQHKEEEEEGEEEATAENVEAVLKLF
jgi:hypothetical protein